MLMAPHARGAGVWGRGGHDGEPLEARYLRCAGGGMNRPPPSPKPWGTAVNVTARRWYPLRFLRDARGRFVCLRRPLHADRPGAARRRVTRVRFDAVQLVF
jgi:hypothetical protein